MTLLIQRPDFDICLPRSKSVLSWSFLADIERYTTVAENKSVCNVAAGQVKI